MQPHQDPINCKEGLSSCKPRSDQDKEKESKKEKKVFSFEKNIDLCRGKRRGRKQGPREPMKQRKPFSASEKRGATFRRGGGGVHPLTGGNRRRTGGGQGGGELRQGGKG